MAHRIEVKIRDEFSDAAGQRLKSRISEDLGIPVKSVRTIDVYTIDGDLLPEHLSRLSQKLFADTIVQEASMSPLAREFSWVIEVGYKPGVTDNVGRTTSEAIRDIIGRDYDVYTSRQYTLRGELRREDVERIAADLLANELIERWEIREYNKWDSQKGFGIYLPVVKLQHSPQVRYLNLAVSDEELMRISKEGVLALSLDEMKAIRNHFTQLGRPPTDAELETLAQTWSEHCRHKIFNGEVEYTDEHGTRIVDSLFHTYIRTPTEEISRRLGRKDWLVSVFSDNAGVVRLDEDYNLVFKVETHNSPSALDPYGGAITGIVGVNRDPMGTGLGSRLIFNTDVFCFADPNYRGNLPSRLKHPKRVFEGVRRGVEHGGNKSGIPTINGTVRFDSYPFSSLTENGVIVSYMGKPLVFCGTGGIAESYINGKPSHEKKANASDAVVLVGGRTGADGIHGATFSSESLSENSPATAVQIGDPITQKKMSDMLIEARKLGLYNSITDNGAGGLSCSVGEMAKESGGAELHLEKVPLKYAGLHPWEILLSEAQERMTLSVPKDKVDQFLELAKRRDVEATVIGKYTDDGRFRTFYEGKPVSDLDMGFLHDGAPKKKMKAVWKQPSYEEPEFDEPDTGWALKALLSRLNICSKEYVVRQYDHEVQGSTVVKPLTGARNDGPSDAAVYWPLEMQRKGSRRGIVVSNGINANYGLIDTYHMAASNIDEAIRNAIAAGANPERIALLDNFCWSSSDDQQRMAQLVRACMALRDYALAFNTPFISGKDSMYNDYKGALEGKDVKVSVPPTLLISALGIMDDVTQAVTMDAKGPGNVLYIVGATGDELGGSEYYAMMGTEVGRTFVGNKVPKVDAASAIQRYRAINQAIKNGYIASCHDCSEGGIGVAAAEMAFSGGYGIDLDLRRVPRYLGKSEAFPRSRKTSSFADVERSDKVLFSESNSRLLVEVPKSYRSAFESLMRSQYAEVGSVTSGDYVRIKDASGKDRASVHIQDLKDAWQSTMRW